MNVVTTGETLLEEHQILAWEVRLFSTMNVETTGKTVARPIEEDLKRQTFA